MILLVGGHACSQIVVYQVVCIYVFIGRKLSYLCPLWVTIGHLIINVDDEIRLWMIYIKYLLDENLLRYENWACMTGAEIIEQLHSPQHCSHR